MIEEEKSIQLQQEETVSRFARLDNEEKQNAVELLFTGGQCVTRSLLSVASSGERQEFNLDQIRGLTEYKHNYRDANDVLDLIFKMEDENMLGNYQLSEYFHSGQAPNLTDLAKAMENNPDLQICISLRAKQTKPGGNEEYAHHMAHISNLKVNNEGVMVTSRSDSDNQMIKDALQSGERYDVFFFKKI